MGKYTLAAIIIFSLTSLAPLHASELAVDPGTEAFSSMVEAESSVIRFSFLTPNFFTEQSTLADPRQPLYTPGEFADLAHLAILPGTAGLSDETLGTLAMLWELTVSQYEGFSMEKWVRAKKDASITTLIGTIPFFSLPPDYGKAVSEHNAFSTDGLFVFWYLRKKF